MNNTSTIADSVLIKRVNGQTYLRFPSLGILYDVAVTVNSSTSSENALGLIHSKEMLCVDIRKLLEIYVTQNPVPNESGGASNYGVYQVTAFMKLLLDIQKSRPKSYDVVFPSLQALLTVSESVWAEFIVPPEFSSLLLRLLDQRLSSKVCADTACNILLKIINSTAKYTTDYVFNELLNSLELNSCLNEWQWKVLIQASDIGKLTVLKIEEHIKDMVIKHKFNQTTSLNDSLLRIFSLDDEVEILGSKGSWFRGSVVKTNMITSEITIEYQDENDSLCIIKLPTSSPAIRKVSTSEDNNNDDPKAKSNIVDTSFTRVFGDDITDLLLSQSYQHLPCRQNLSSPCNCGVSFSLQQSVDSYVCGFCKTRYGGSCLSWTCSKSSCHACLLCRPRTHLFETENVKPSSNNVSYFEDLAASSLSPNFCQIYQTDIEKRMAYSFAVSDSIFSNVNGTYEFSHWEWSGESKRAVYENFSSRSATESTILEWSIESNGKYRWFIASIGHQQKVGGDNILKEHYHCICNSRELPDRDVQWTLTDQNTLKIVNNIRVDLLKNYQPMTTLKLMSILLGKMKLDCTLNQNIEMLRKDLIVAATIHITAVPKKKVLSNVPDDVTMYHSSIRLANEHMLSPVSLDPQNIFSCELFDQIMYEINVALMDYLIALSKNNTHQASPLDQACWEFIDALSATKYGLSLLPAFVYRPLLVKYGIVLQEYVSNELTILSRLSTSNGSIDFIVDSFSQIERFKHVCVGVIVNCTRRNVTIQSYLTDEINLITKQKAFTALADGIIAIFRQGGMPATNLPSLSRLNGHQVTIGMKEFIQRALLVSSNRLAKESRDIRRLLRHLRENMSSESISYLEVLWRDSISDWLFVYLKQSLKLKSTEEPFPNVEFTYNLVETLVAMFKKALDVSVVDVSLENSQNLVESAFSYTFRRLSINESFELTKLFAVYASVLIDTSKSNCFTKNWQDLANSSTLLIRVLFNNTTIEFQYLYELLLARRLLKNRFFSVDMEYTFLHSLPATNCGSLMVHDIFATNRLMDDFRKFILNRIDADFTYSDDVKSLVFESNVLQIHSLSSELWPLSLISPIPYAGMILPSVMNSIALEYEAFFQNQNERKSFESGNAFFVSKVENIASFQHRIQCSFPCSLPSVCITCKDLDIDNEVFAATFSQKNPNLAPIYVSRITTGLQGIRIVYEPILKAWNMYSARSDQIDNLSHSDLIATCITNKYVPLHLLESNTWLLASSHQHKSSSDKSLFFESSNSLHHDSIEKSVCAMSISLYRSNNFQRRLFWCHEGGLLDVKFYLPFNLSCFLRITEPQAAILLRFCINSDDYESTELSADDLSRMCNLSKNEVIEITKTLTTPACPVLSSSFGKFQLSQMFLSGSLGGYHEKEPILVSSFHERNCSDGSIADEGIIILNGWRNELLDAAIVKYLKEVSINKLGDINYSKGTQATAVSIDKFCEDIKNLLINRFKVTDEDIMRRSDHLSSLNVIEKVHGPNIGLRSVGYTYLSEIETRKLQGRDTPIRSALPAIANDKSESNETSGDVLKGADLFNYICYLFSLPQSSTTTISKQLFSHKFISWAARSTFRVNVSESITVPVLSHICINLLNRTREADIQLFCLKKQFTEGLNDGIEDQNYALSLLEDNDRLRMSEQLFSGLKLIDDEFSTGSLFSLFGPPSIKKATGDKSPPKPKSASDSPKKSKLELKEALERNLNRVFLEHLPIELFREFMKHMRVIAEILNDRMNEMAEDRDREIEVDSEVDHSINSKEIIECSIYTHSFTAIDESGDMDELYVSERKDLCDEFNDLITSGFESKLSYSFLQEIIPKEVLDILVLETPSREHLRALSPMESTATTKNGDYEFHVSNPFGRNLSSSPRGINPVSSILSSSTRLDQFNRDRIPRLFAGQPFSQTNRRNRDGFGAPQVRTRTDDSIANTLSSIFSSPELNLDGGISSRLSVSPPLHGFRPHMVAFPPRPGALSSMIRRGIQYGYMDDDDDDDDDNDDDDNEGEDYISINIPGDPEIAIPRVLGRENDREINRLPSNGSTGRAKSAPNSPGQYSQNYPTYGLNADNDDLVIELSLESVFNAYFKSIQPDLVELLNDEDGSNTSFQSFIHRYFFSGLCSNLAQTLGVDLPYELPQRKFSEVDTPLSTARKLSPRSNDSSDVIIVETVYLPCEFCTETIPIQYFQIHQDACQQGLRIQLPVSARNVASDTPQEKDLERRHYPSISCELTHSLMTNLFDAATYSAMNASNKKILSPSQAALRAHKSTFKRPLRRNDSYSMSALIYQCFDTMDIHHKGSLNRKDFVSYIDESTAYTGGSVSNDIDPINLYGRVHNEDLENPPIVDKNLLLMNLSQNAPVLSSSGKDSMSSSPLPRVDSLWRSLAQDKDTPSLDPNRSVFGIDGAHDELDALVKRTKDILNESTSITLALLINYNWDSKRLIEDYIDDTLNTRSKVGLGPKDKPSFLRHDLFNESSLNSSELFDKSSTVQCGICFCDQPRNETFSLTCRHWFCQDCWQGYLVSSTNNRDVKIKCPQPKCSCIVTLDMYECLCDTKTASLAKEYIAEAYVQGRQGKKGLATYCKNPRGCSGIVIMDDDADSSDACCSFCNFSFCSLCDLAHHAPADCQQLVKWEEREGYLERGSEEEILARQCKLKTTKPCPKCSVRIEKNGGCPHITCKFCKNQFCWECGGEFHTTTVCSRPKLSADTNPVFEFEELNRECVTLFGLRKTALSYMHAAQANTKRTDLSIDPTSESVLRGIKIDGWRLIADAQAALAYSCIVRYDVKTDRMKILYNTQNLLTQTIYSKFLDLETKNQPVDRSIIWKSIAANGHGYPDLEFKSSIRLLRRRLREYIRAVRIEIFTEKPESQSEAKPQTQPSNSPSSGTPGRRPLAQEAWNARNNLVPILRSRNTGSNSPPQTGSPSRSPPRPGPSARGRNVASLEDMRSSTLFGQAFD